MPEGCECCECFIINIVNAILSVVIVLMNGVYVVWGLMLPSSKNKEVWNDYKKKLELYVSVVSYSDAVVLPLKLITMILVKWCCCQCKKIAEPKDVDETIYKNTSLSNYSGSNDTFNNSNILTANYSGRPQQRFNYSTSPVSPIITTSYNSNFTYNSRNGVSEFHMNP